MTSFRREIYYTPMDQGEDPKWKCRSTELLMHSSHTRRSFVPPQPPKIKYADTAAQKRTGCPRSLHKTHLVLVASEEGDLVTESQTWKGGPLFTLFSLYFGMLDHIHVGTIWDINKFYFNQYERNICFLAPFLTLWLLFKDSYPWSLKCS